MQIITVNCLKCNLFALFSSNIFLVQVKWLILQHQTKYWSDTENNNNQISKQNEKTENLPDLWQNL
jgi:hypothetical protein